MTQLSLDGFAIERVDVALVPSQTNDGHDLKIDLRARYDARCRGQLVENQPRDIHELILDVSPSVIASPLDLRAFVHKHVLALLAHEVDEWLAVDGVRTSPHGAPP